MKKVNLAHIGIISDKGNDVNRLGYFLVVKVGILASLKCEFSIDKT